MSRAVRVLSLVAVIAVVVGLVLGMRRRAVSDAALLDPMAPAAPVPPVG